jgi:hypothetical protein
VVVSCGTTAKIHRDSVLSLSSKRPKWIWFSGMQKNQNSAGKESISLSGVVALDPEVLMAAVPPVYRARMFGDGIKGTEAALTMEHKVLPNIPSALLKECLRGGDFARFLDGVENNLGVALVVNPPFNCIDVFGTKNVFRDDPRLMEKCFSLVTYMNTTLEARAQERLLNVLGHRQVLSNGGITTSVLDPFSFITLEIYDVPSSAGSKSIADSLPVGCTSPVVFVSYPAKPPSSVDLSRQAKLLFRTFQDAERAFSSLPKVPGKGYDERCITIGKEVCSVRPVLPRLSRCSSLSGKLVITFYGGTASQTFSTARRNVFPQTHSINVRGNAELSRSVIAALQSGRCKIGSSTIIYSGKSDKRDASTVLVYGVTPEAGTRQLEDALLDVLPDLRGKDFFVSVQRENVGRYGVEEQVQAMTILCETFGLDPTNVRSGTVKDSENCPVRMVHASVSPSLLDSFPRDSNIAGLGMVHISKRIEWTRVFRGDLRAVKDLCTKIEQYGGADLLVKQIPLKNQREDTSGDGTKILVSSSSMMEVLRGAALLCSTLEVKVLRVKRDAIRQWKSISKELQREPVDCELDRDCGQVLIVGGKDAVHCAVTKFQSVHDAVIRKAESHVLKTKTLTLSLPEQLEFVKTPGFATHMTQLTGAEVSCVDGENRLVCSCTIKGNWDQIRLAETLLRSAKFPKPLPCKEHGAQITTSVLACSHNFCRKCLLAHVESKVAESLFPILCPTCNKEVSVADLRFLLDRESFWDLQLRSITAFSSSTTMVHMCPSQNCNAVVCVDSAAQMCHMCMKLWCTTCWKDVGTRMCPHVPDDGLRAASQEMRERRSFVVSSLGLF